MGGEDYRSVKETSHGEKLCREKREGKREKPNDTRAYMCADICTHIYTHLHGEKKTGKHSMMRGKKGYNKRHIKKFSPDLHRRNGAKGNPEQWV